MARGEGTVGGLVARELWTVPNALSLGRLALIPVFVVVVFGARDDAAAAFILAGLGATDWLDGWIARRFNQVTTLGKVLDPAADRMLLGAAVASIIVTGAVPLWFGILTIVREALVSGAVVVLAALGAERIDVLWVGKAGTFGLMAAYPAFLLSDGTAGWQSPFHVLAWVFGIPGLALAWAAAVAYVGPARSALASRRRAVGPVGVPSQDTGAR